MANDAYDNARTDREMLDRFGGYPAPHYDEDDDCQCPDHKAQREARARDLIPSVRDYAAGRSRGLLEALGFVGPKPTKRDLAMMGLAPDTKRAIVRMIELNPVLEEAILNIADLAYRDGADSRD